MRKFEPADAVFAIVGCMVLYLLVLAGAVVYAFWGFLI